MRASEPFLEVDRTLVPSEVTECNLLSRKNAAVFTPNEEATPITKTAAERGKLTAFYYQTSTILRFISFQ